MRKTVALLLAVIIAAMSALSVFAADYSYSLYASDKSVKAGDIVKIDLGISEGLTGIDIVINYDAQKLEFIEGSYSDLMMGFPNESQSGTVHIAAVSTEPVPAGLLYSFKVRVLASGGEVTAHVKEALDVDDNDVSSSMKDISFKIKASGTYQQKESVSGPVVTAAPGAQTQADVSNTNSVSVGSPDADGNKNNNTVSNPSSDSTEADRSVTRGQTKDSDKTSVQEEKSSKLGLTVALTVGILALCGITVLVFSKRGRKADGEKNGGSADEDSNGGKQDDK